MEDSPPLQSLLTKKASDIMDEYHRTAMLSTTGRKKIITISVSDLVAKSGL